MSTQPKRFGKRRWRRPERMTLDHGPVVRRKDLGVQEPVAVEPAVARRASRIQIQILLGVFAALCVLEGAIVGFLVGHPFIATVAVAVYGGMYFFVAREFGDSWIVRAIKATPSDGTRVTRLAAAEAQNAQIPVPRVLVSPGSEPNAASFALRRRWLVTTSGAEALDELALEGMIAHEIVHLRDGESSVASLFCVLAGAPELLFRGGGVLAALAIPIWPVCLAMKFARRAAAPASREHRADVAAAMLTRYPPGIVSALAEAGGATSGLRPFDGFWFAARDGSDGPSARASLIAEM